MTKFFRITFCLLTVFAGLLSTSPALADDQPDLQPAQILVTTLYAGATNAVTVVVANNGNTAASDLAVRLECNGNEVETRTGISVAPENDPWYWPASVKFDWNPAEAGEYALTAIVDSNDAIVESDETNNQMEITAQVLASEPVKVNVRVEGKTALIWSGEVTFRTSSITDKQGATHAIDHPTALGALSQAAQAGGFCFVVSSSYGPLSFVEAVDDEVNQGMDGWLYRVNWASADVAASDYTLAANDEVLWYYGGWTAQPLKVEIDKDSLLYGENFSASVEAYDGFSWSAISGATLYAGSRRYITGEDGKVTDISLTPGGYNVYAIKGDYTQFIRSNQIHVVVYVPLNLQPGWNFISFPKRLAADNCSAQEVFNAVDTAGHSIFTYDACGGWTAIEPETVIMPLEGIWIYSEEAIELHPVFDTNPRQVPPSKQLSSGWNAVGYSDFSPTSASSALTSVESKWTTLISFDAETQTYETSIINNAPSEDPHSELREMFLWKGYWLYLSGPGELSAISS